MFYFNANDTDAIDPQALKGVTEQAARELLAANGVRVFDYKEDVNTQVIRDAIDGKAVSGNVSVNYMLAEAYVSFGKVLTVHVINRTAEAVACVLVSTHGPVCGTTSFEMWDLTPEHGYIDRLEFEC